MSFDSFQASGNSPGSGVVGRLTTSGKVSDLDPAFILIEIEIQKHLAGAGPRTGPTFAEAA
jgi:hypothetical protein